MNFFFGQYHLNWDSCYWVSSFKMRLNFMFFNCALLIIQLEVKYQNGIIDLFIYCPRKNQLGFGKPQTENTMNWSITFSYLALLYFIRQSCTKRLSKSIQSSAPTYYYQYSQVRCDIRSKLKKSIYIFFNALNF